MIVKKIRVLPRVSRKGVLPLCAGAGALHGLIGAWLAPTLVEWLASSGPGGMISFWGTIRGIALAGLVLIAPAFAAGMLLSRVHRRVLTEFLAAVCYGAACVAGMLAAIVGYNPEVLLWIWNGPGVVISTLALVFTVAVYGAIGSGVVAAMFAAGCALERMLGRRVVVQDGLTCWRCGYNLGAASIVVCPECGREFDPEKPAQVRSLVLLEGLVGWRRGVIVLALMIAIVPIGYRLVTHTIPSVRFFQACPTRWRVRPIGIGTYVWTGGGTRTISYRPLRAGWWIPRAGSPEEGFAVQFLPDGPAERECMFISKAQLKNPTAGAPVAMDQWWVQAGTTHVIARLNREQARRVIVDRKVPEGLLEAIETRAQSNGWKPTTGTAWTSGPENAVDATPYFSHD